MAEARFWRADGDAALLVQVRLTPKSSTDRIDGLQADSAGRPRLRARVRAVPADGKANKALTAVLAKSLGIPKSAVTVVAGHVSRTKTLRIDGDPLVLAAALEELGAS